MWSKLMGLGAKTLTIIALVAALFIGMGVYSCTQRGAINAQNDQNMRSGEAAADAGREAVETVGAAGERERSLGDLVDDVTEGIEDAETREDARAATIAGLCRLPAYRDDASCQLP